MSPINLHDIFPATAGIRVGTLLELGERVNVKSAGPARFKLTSFEVKIITSFRDKVDSYNKTSNHQCVYLRTQYSCIPLN